MTRKIYTLLLFTGIHFFGFSCADFPELGIGFVDINMYCSVYDQPNGKQIGQLYSDSFNSFILMENGDRLEIKEVIDCGTGDVSLHLYFF